MMTLKRFRATTDSYGADLRRWPGECRAEAQALLECSAAARAILDEARQLDQAIETAGRVEAERLGSADEQDAALARLRAVVGARIAALAAPRRPVFSFNVRLRDAVGGHLGWFGMTASGGIAVLAGLMIGSMDLTPPAQDNLLSMLEPAPIGALAE